MDGFWDSSEISCCLLLPCGTHIVGGFDMYCLQKGFPLPQLLGFKCKAWAWYFDTKGLAMQLWFSALSIGLKKCPHDFLDFALFWTVAWSDCSQKRSEPKRQAWSEEEGKWKRCKEFELRLRGGVAPVRVAATLDTAAHVSANITQNMQYAHICHRNLAK